MSRLNGPAVLLLVVFLLPACSTRLPALNPLAVDMQSAALDECRAVFPRGSWQLTHAIEAAFPGGGEKLLMGVTVVDAARQTIGCALLTVEGLVLFQARLDAGLHVERALPPFDREGFAAGMLADIRLMFLEPDAASVEIGRTARPGGTEFEPVCRYVGEKGLITDVIPATPVDWHVFRYGPRGRLVRTVAAQGTGGQAGFPGRIQLQAPGPAGYTLKMKLVDAVRTHD